ncbi:MAG: endonuclease III [Oscillospiraceae bacterium]|nr:endonuclease III [Candidatus Equicaccousia limihippi]
MEKTVKKAVELLKKEYPQAICSLCYDDPFQLLVATRLSAQCTDARVNMVTPELFKALPNPESFKNAEVETIEHYIKSCGLYKTKAKDLKAMATVLCDKFGGKVPGNMEDLVSLPGVGRKTANLIIGDVYGGNAVVCDTHFIRICNRLGFIDTTDPKKTEDIMRKLLPKSESNDFCHRTVLHGRAVCTARKPYCEKCVLNGLCRYAAQNK